MEEGLIDGKGYYEKKLQITHDFVSSLPSGDLPVALSSQPLSAQWSQVMGTRTKHPIDREMRWNFGDSRGTSLSLDEFLAQKEAAGVEFFAGKEPWLVGLRKLSCQTFFRVCTEEMDDLSQRL